MKTHLNLLPVELQRRQIVRRCVRQWSVVWVISSVSLAALIGWEWRRAQVVVERCKTAEARLAPVRELQDKNQRLGEKIQSLETREALVLALSSERPMLTLLGIVAQASQAAQGRVSVQQLQWIEPRSSSSDGNSAGAAILRLEGTGMDNLSIARFAAALRDINLFSQVQVNASNAGDASTGERRSYAIECSL